MTFWEYALTLFDVALWIPVGAGLIARTALFHRGRNVLDREADPSPLPGADDFPLENDEPTPDDPNYVPVE